MCIRDREMVTFGARISELAVQEVADIVASGVNLQPGTLDWSSAEDYAEWQRSNPDWQKTIVAMSKVQVMPDGEIIARKLNTPINDFPREPFRRIALDPRMTALASEFLGGRRALVYSDQVFIKPRDVGGPKPYHQDNWYFGVSSSDDVITAWVSVDDAVEENGALRYIDGAHRRGLVPHAVTNPCEPLPSPVRTEALLMSSRACAGQSPSMSMPWSRSSTAVARWWLRSRRAACSSTTARRSTPAAPTAPRPTDGRTPSITSLRIVSSTRIARQP